MELELHEPWLCIVWLRRAKGITHIFVLTAKHRETLEDSGWLLGLVEGRS
jgi:hypothetical protein